MEALRQIPPVNDVLRSPQLEPFRDVLAQPFASAIIESVFSDIRRELSASANNVSRSELTTRIANEVGRRIRTALQPSLVRVINATGVVLHTNLGRAPLPEGAIELLREASVGYSNLEFETEEGLRGRRDTHTANLLKQVLSCEAAIVVNNNAAAVLLVLNTFGEGGDVIVSRGELVEIGDSFRIPDIMGRSGAQLREVGSTNRTQIRDYETAISESTRLLLRVHPSNFRIIGFTTRPSLEEFIELGRRHNIPTYEDLGSGYLTSTESVLTSDEPSAQASIRAGIDITSFSGDKLLGGPQAGIIAGKRIQIEKLRKNPLYRALRVDKLTIAVLEYVLRAHLRGDVAALPTWRMLNATEAELKARTESFASRAGKAAIPIALKSIPGGGSAPETYIPSWGIALNIDSVGSSEIEKRLRHSKPAVIGRVEDGRVILDFRTIFPAEEAELLNIVQQIQGLAG